jgi:hypothetical protein
VPSPRLSNASDQAGRVVIADVGQIAGDVIPNTAKVVGEKPFPDAKSIADRKAGGKLGLGSARRACTLPFSPGRFCCSSGFPAFKVDCAAR